MRGASVNFQKIHSAMHAVSHASRSVPPDYLLPPEHSLGTYVVIDDSGAVQEKLTEKMALASRQAKASKDYSPLWEGVINLPAPSKSVTAEHQCQIVKEWCEQYEAITGHKVLRADVHLDEGFVDANGRAQFNAHAHVMCDRTDAAGKVIKLSPKQLREVQGMTAEVTQLERGKDARTTRRKHLNHHQFRFTAEQNREKSDQSKTQYNALLDTQIKALNAERKKVKDLSAELAAEKAKNVELAALVEQYRNDREALKASGTATQKDYQALKAQHLAMQAELKQARSDQVETQTALGQVEKDLARTGQALMRESVANAELQAELKALRTPQNAPKAQPLPTPQKTLPERLEASFRAAMEWIQGKSGLHQAIDRVRDELRGPVLHLDELHAVQKVGRREFAIHQLADLDKVPELDEVSTTIRYSHGRATVQQPSRGMDLGR